MSIIKIVQNNQTNKSHCIVCGRSNGILSCHGCRLTYCGKHVLKHRQDLGEQLNDIMYDCDLIREDIEQSANDHLHYQKIDRWEKETIKKVQLAAESARDDLRQILDKSRRRLLRISNELGANLKTSYKNDDFAENEISKWARQLNELRTEMKTVYSIQLIEDQRYPIYPITFTNSYFQFHSNNQIQPYKLPNQELFSKTTSSAATIENNGQIVKHIGSESDYVHILGKQLYSQGRHTNRFKILRSSRPYIIFFGCISAETPTNAINYNSQYAVGWFGYNEIYQHGIWKNAMDKYGYDSSEIETNDILQLTFDCDHRYIELILERTNRTYRLPVNIEKAPFPWQVLVVLVHEDDCVKILPRR